MQARWMDPNAGTFLSIDPLVGDAFDPQAVNAYSYARNNPVAYTDPTGMACFALPIGGTFCIFEESNGFFNYPNPPSDSTTNSDSGAGAGPGGSGLGGFSWVGGISTGTTGIGPVSGGGSGSSRSTDIGVQYAQAGELTPEQARQMIANAQNPHPGVSPGFDDNHSLQTEVFGEVLVETYLWAGAAAAGELVGPAVVPLARGAVTASRFVAAADFTNNFRGGFTAGKQGFAFEPTGASTAAKLGAGIGYATGVFDRVVGIGKAIKAVTGMLD